MNEQKTKPTAEEIQAKIREKVKARFMHNGNPINATHVYDYGIMHLYQMGWNGTIKKHEITHRSEVGNFFVFILKSQGPVVFGAGKHEATGQNATYFTDPVHMLKKDKRIKEQRIKDMKLQLLDLQIRLEQAEEEYANSSYAEAEKIRTVDAEWITANYETVSVSRTKKKKQGEMMKDLNITG